MSNVCYFTVNEEGKQIFFLNKLNGIRVLRTEKNKLLKAMCHQCSFIASVVEGMWAHTTVIKNVKLK